MSDYFPLAVQVRKIQLENYNGTKQVDIEALGEELNIYEDILSPTMYGNIIINDALELLAEFPINGQEKLTVEFRTDPQGDFFKHIFQTYKIENVQRQGDKSQSYIIHFASPEIYNNVQRRVVNGYSGSIDNIALKVYNDYIKTSDKPFILEPTRNSRTIAFPTISPFGAMRMLSDYGYSQENFSSNYVFFEDRDGFYFKTIDSFIKDVEEPVEYYHYGPANIIPEIDSTSVESFEITSYRDTIKHIEDGMYGQKLLALDIRSKSFKESNFDYRKNFDDIAHLEKNPLLAENTSLSSEDVVLLPTSEFTEGYEEYYLHNLSSIAQLDTIVLEIAINGDERRKPGDVIEFNISNATDLEELENKPHKYLSGRYLVSRVRHKINGVNYRVIMQCVKNAAKKKIESKDEQNDTF